MDQTLLHRRLDEVIGSVGRVIVGKEEVLEHLLVALLTGGHVILEDVPGTGKTLMAKALARTLDCEFRRIQFTADLLPSDVTGINYYNQRTGAFELRRGPVFANVLLADELNRATPRTQSSLLECMEERQVTIDGETYRLAEPFLVVATQNPIDNHGTFPLPEAQLDRFMMRVRMGYPSAEEEERILRRFAGESPLEELASVLGREEIAGLRQLVPQVFVAADMAQYLLAIVQATRAHADIELGVSPRGSLQLLKAAQARALLHGRDYVVPDDVKALALPVLAHRIIVKDAFRAESGRAAELIGRIAAGVTVPSETALERR